jgi:hypothetical protein
LLTDGTVLVVGGVTTRRFEFVATAERYDPRTGLWSEAGTSLVFRSGHTATLLGDGRVLVAGGLTYVAGDAALSRAAVAELYGP